MSDDDRVDREGHWAQQAEAQLPDRRWREEVEGGLAYGLEAADSIIDRTLPTFARAEIPHIAGERGTFMKCPYVEDVHDVGDAERVGIEKIAKTALELAWQGGRRSICPSTDVIDSGFVPGTHLGPLPRGVVRSTGPLPAPERAIRTQRRYPQISGEA